MENYANSVPLSTMKNLILAAQTVLDWNFPYNFILIMPLLTRNFNFGSVCENFPHNPMFFVIVPLKRWCIALTQRWVLNWWSARCQLMKLVMFYRYIWHLVTDDGLICCSNCDLQTAPVFKAVITDKMKRHYILSSLVIVCLHCDCLQSQTSIMLHRCGCDIGE